MALSVRCYEDLILFNSWEMTWNKTLRGVYTRPSIYRFPSDSRCLCCPGRIFANVNLRRYFDERITSRFLPR